MLSFRSIFIAAAAFATIASAIPAAPPTPNIPGVPGSAGDARALDLVGGLGGLLHLDGGIDVSLGGPHGLGGAARPATLAGLPTKGSSTSPGDIFKTCSDGIELIVVKIVAAVNVEGGAKNVDLGLVIGLLGEIVLLLQIAVKDLKVIVVAELTLNGIAITLLELAGVVAGLLTLVIKVVWLVLSIVGFVNVTLCGVIATIGTLLSELLEVVLSLVPGLKVEVVVLIKPFVDQYNFVRFTQILDILGIRI